MQEIIPHGAQPDGQADHDGVIHGLERRVRIAREHGEDDAEEQKRDGRPGEGRGEAVACVERAGFEFGAAPEHAAEDGNAPGDVVAGDGEAEDGLAGGGGDEGQEANDRGGEGAGPDCSERDVSESAGDGADEGGEWKGS